MKTVCVAVVVLSLISLCQPASLQCKQPVKFLDQSPDVLGVWYLIGMSSTLCWAQALLNSVFVPSFRVNVTSTETQHYYDINVKVKAYGVCETESMQFSHVFNTLYGIDDQKNLRTEDKGMLLQSGCPDCLLISGYFRDGILALFSRRPVITADEIKEFETQAECSGKRKPYIFGSDHDYDSCGTTDFEFSQLARVIKLRLKGMFSQLFTCTEDTVYFPRAAHRWAQQAWASLW